MLVAKLNPEPDRPPRSMTLPSFHSVARAPLTTLYANAPPGVVDAESIAGCGARQASQVDNAASAPLRGVKDGWLADAVELTMSHRLSRAIDAVSYATRGIRQAPQVDDIAASPFGGVESALSHHLPGVVDTVGLVAS
jgi:hypothetical protein